VLQITRSIDAGACWVAADQQRAEGWDEGRSLDLLHGV
jgi:hypothetical protein